MNDKEEKFIKIHATLDRVLYPKPPQELGEGAIGDNYGIVTWDIIEVDEGDPAVSDKYGSVTIKGGYESGVLRNIPYTIVAKQLEDSNYGPQYKLVYYNQEIDFSTVRNQRAFLRSFLSELQVEELFKACPNPLDAISRHDINALTKAKGIGNIIAQKIIKRFEDSKDYSSVYLNLDELGLTSAFISKLIAKYKTSQTIIDIINKDPYRLIYDVDGIGFLTADKIALKNHFAPTDVRRIKAYIVWLLTTQGEEGNSYITVGELVSNMYNDLGGKEAITENYEFPQDHEGENSNITLAIKQLKDEDKVIIEDNDNVSKSNRRVYLKEIWKLEREIAYHLKRLLEAKGEFEIEDFDRKIKKIEAKQGFEFTDEQIEGIKLGLNSQVCLISGLAGSGKSSLVTGILAVLDQYTFAQTALAGKAAARLQEITGQEGKTIHRLLGYSMEGFTYNEDNPLSYDIIILDEISMVGGEIFLDLLKAIPSGSKLYMLGDLGQLESVGLLNLAADLYNSSVIPMVDLKQVHRQAKASGILTTAYDVRHQVKLFESDQYEGNIITGENKDMIIDCSKDRESTREKVMSYFKKCYEGKLVNKNIEKIEIISPVKERGDTCVFNFNMDVQEYVNPIDSNKPNVYIKKNKNQSGKDFSYFLQQGDKVMCIKNNYHVLDISGAETEIFNGWTGKIVKIVNINKGSENINGKYDKLVPYMLAEGMYDSIAKLITHNVKIMIIDFDLGNNLVCLPLKDVPSHIVLGYACTCHKMQGSAADVIICVINWETPPTMLTSQLVYTMLTRAKKRCILVCQSPALSKAILTNFVSSKRTFLPEFLDMDYKKLLAIHNKEKELEKEKRKNYIDSLRHAFSEVEDDEEYNE